MSVLSGVFQVVKESIFHPMEDSVLLDTNKGYLPIRKGTDFSDANLEGANLQGANLAGSLFRRANLKDTNFDGCNLTNADFTGAVIENTSFEGAKLDGAIGLKERV
jgi:uncharacterized protein YjbI with pentapeptide repeats